MESRRQPGKGVGEKPLGLIGGGGPPTLKLIGFEKKV
jgi:hypothetical protein